MLCVCARARVCMCVSLCRRVIATDDHARATAVALVVSVGEAAECRTFTRNTVRRLRLSFSTPPTTAHRIAMPTMTFHSPNTNTKFKLDKVAGRGQFGVAYRVVSMDAKRDLQVIKVLDMHTSSDAAKKEAKKEVDILKMSSLIGNPNLVEYLDSWWHRGRLHILMEYADDGSLEGRIKELAGRGKRFSAFEIKSISDQLIAALYCCHYELEIIHRDIKPANVLLFRGGIAKITDFGVSATDNLCYTMAGTPIYMAPEMADGQEYSKEVDVWGMGCTLYEAMSLKSPWCLDGVRTVHDLMQKIKTQDVDIYALIEMGYDQSICALVRKMLEKNPQDRPTMKQAMRCFEMQPVETAMRETITAAMTIQKMMRRSMNRKSSAPPSPTRHAMDSRPCPSPAFDYQKPPHGPPARFETHVTVDIPDPEEQFAAIAHIQAAFRASRMRRNGEQDNARMRHDAPQHAPLRPSARRQPVAKPRSAMPRFPAVRVPPTAREERNVAYSRPASARQDPSTLAHDARKPIATRPPSAGGGALHHGPKRTPLRVPKASERTETLALPQRNRMHPDMMMAVGVAPTERAVRKVWCM